MDEIYWKDTRGNIRVVERSGGPEVTELSYIDGNDATVKFSIPTIQDITFSQSKNISSRHTARGSYRQQFGQENPPTVSFSIIMNEDIFNGLKNLAIRNDLITTGISDSIKQEALARSKYDINSIVKGSENSYTIKQLIEALESVKLNGYRVALTTSSPLDDMLEELVITDINYVHTATSREIVSCTIKCTIVKLVSAEFKPANKIDILGITVSAEPAGEAQLITKDVKEVKVDGNTKFGGIDIPFTDLRVYIGNSINDFVGRAIRAKIPDTEDLDWYMESEIFKVNGNSKTAISFKFISDLIGSNLTDDDGKLYQYTVSLGDIRVDFTEEPDVAPTKLYSANEVVSPVISAYGKYYSMVLSYPQLDFDQYGLYEGYNVRKANAFINKSTTAKEEFDPKVSEPPIPGDNLVLDLQDYVYGEDIKEKYSYVLSAKHNGTWQTIKSDVMTDDLAVHTFEIATIMDFDFGNPLTKADILSGWFGQKDSYPDSLLNRPIYFTFVTKGNEAQIFLFSKNSFNSRKVVGAI